ncbi:MAG TPA: hypothetical protein PKK10_09635 [Woeseiaceae bacterium]|nr:hypothetical protein [Woeseiaceae bacterium]
MAASSDDTTLFEEEAKRRVRDAIEIRQVADFSALPSEQRRLPATYLQRLISGSDSDGARLCCPLRIKGADITGVLLPPTSAQDGGRTALQFRDCRFDAAVDLSGAEFLVLRFINCTLPAFIGAGLRVRADLDFSGSTFTGVRDFESELSHVGTCAIHLNNAHIGGKLDLSSNKGSRFSATGTIRLDGAHVDGDVSLAGALLDGRGEPALSARSINIGGNMRLKPAAGNRCEATGEIVFAAAHITGDLDCDGARFWNPDGRAMHCEDLRVESVFLSRDDPTGQRFEAAGRLNFLSAVIGGSFFLTEARLIPGPDYTDLQKKGGPIALNLRQARISNALGLRNNAELEDSVGPPAKNDARRPVQGWFLLTGAELSSILDNVETGWPAAGFLDLEGARYSWIRHVGSGDLIARRVAWLRLQFPRGKPNARSFRPQPYEELTRVLRQHGLTSEADAIAVEKIRMRLAAKVDGPWSRIFPRLLMLISSYGYSTRRAVMSFVIFVLLGAGMYATALFGFQQPFLPIESDPAPVTYQFAFGWLQLTTDRGCPGLDVMHYALDAALPVIDLSQDLRCRFSPEGPGRELWLLLHSLFVIAGAALSAVVVLTLTGVLRRD